MKNRFKKYEGLKPLFSELKSDVQKKKKKIIGDSDDDLGLNFFPTIDIDFLRENSDAITPDSFVYMYALSDEEREYLDSIRENTISLKRKLD